MLQWGRGYSTPDTVQMSRYPSEPMTAKASMGPGIFHPGYSSRDSMPVCREFPCPCERYSPWSGRRGDPATSVRRIMPTCRENGRSSASRRSRTTSPLASPDRSLVTARQRPPRADELNAPEATTGGRPEVEDADAVLVQVHLEQEVGSQSQQLDSGQIAHEDGVLQRLAVALGDLVHPTQPPCVPDVIGEQVPGPVGHRAIELSKAGRWKYRRGAPRRASAPGSRGSAGTSPGT